MRFIVFSKDRPCQCHALLSSAIAHLPTCIPIVLFKASTPEYRQGYEMLSERITAQWIEEQDFRQDLLDIMDAPKNASGDQEPLCAFAVDDIIFRKRIMLNQAYMALHDPNVLCMSYRLSPKIDFCYSEDIETPPPAFRQQLFAKDKNILTWEWQGLPGDWGYPFSTDMHVYRTSEMCSMLHKHHFHNPNTLEGALARDSAHWKKRRLMACMTEHCVVNVPANLVQKTFPNRYAEGDDTVERLNNLYLSGLCIDWESVAAQQNTACHWPIQYPFKPYLGD